MLSPVAERHMSEETEIKDRLRSLVQPYFGRDSAVNLEARFSRDLGITGSDYLDLVADVERTFSVNLHDFLVGPKPEHVSTGLAGWIAGEPTKPVYRDVSIKEVLSFIQSR